MTETMHANGYTESPHITRARAIKALPHKIKAYITGKGQWGEAVNLGCGFWLREHDNMIGLHVDGFKGFAKVGFLDCKYDASGLCCGTEWRLHPWWIENVNMLLQYTSVKGNKRPGAEPFRDLDGMGMYLRRKPEGA